MKLYIKHITFLMAVLLLYACEVDSRPGIETTQQVMNSIIYVGDEDNCISAISINVDLDEKKLSLDMDELYQISAENGWISRIYPHLLFSNRLVMSHLPLNSKFSETIEAEDNTIFFKDFTLLFDKTEWIIMQGSEIIAKIVLSQEEFGLVPRAFYINKDNDIVILGHTDDLFIDESYTASIILKKEKDSYNRTKVVFSCLYDETNGLNRLHIPAYFSKYPYNTNIHSSELLDGFLWREGQSIVKLNPYTGDYSILFSISDVEKSMPFFDTYREGYNFFTGLGHQNGIFALVFPNYNDVRGTIAAFFSDTGTYLGYLLCDEHCVYLFDENNMEVFNSAMESFGLLYFSVE